MSSRHAPCSLHDALPICGGEQLLEGAAEPADVVDAVEPVAVGAGDLEPDRLRPHGVERELLVEEPHERADGRLRVVVLGHADRKSTRLNSSHVAISYSSF